MSKGSIVSGGTDGDYQVTIDRLDGTPLTIQAWCADLTEDLSGEVGVIEIAGDIDKGVNIQPGYDGNAAYNANRDGELKEVQEFPNTKPTGEVYWNWAMRPGWQKWRPNYRYGTISNIDYDNDTCDVALDACYATDTPDGEQLDINQTASLKGVGIQYMDCNAGAFEDGDKVLVEFEDHDWSKPRVIGFKEEPKACIWEPWGETLCANRDWWTYIAGDGLYKNELCPGLPISSGGDVISLTDGQIRLQSTGVDANAFVWTGWAYWADTGVRINDVTHIVLKWNRSVSGGGNTDAWIKLQDENDNYGTIRDDNGGNVMELSLASLGLSNNIKYVELLTQVDAWESGSAEIINDYINFVKKS